MGRFGEVVTAMVTPFADDGALDLDAAVALARWLTDHGSDGLVVAGTTGESPVLTDDEKLDLWRAVAEAVTVPVVAGSGSNDTRHSAELTRRASQTGVAGILAVTPYYNRPPQAGIEAHFRAVAAATDLPVLVYDIPIRSGRKIAHDVLVRLAREVPNVVGVKDAAGDVVATARLAADTPSSFEVYSGDDAFVLPHLSVGAVGLVGVATHWAGEQVRQLIAAFTKGDVETARAVNAILAESFAFEASDLAPNPIPAKAMLRVLGHGVGQCRLPMGPAPEGLEAQAAEVWARLEQATAALGRHG
jgi:4-hydroxy-tetrahydrodipicolinate synthase